uniref:Transmembrane protein 17B n=1 Tax=Schistocephalus solidus TaxID=70667 RepID=A0A183TT28_SCHSO
LIYTFTEITRLYLGFIGNLAEKVPELAAFWLLSLLIQLPGIFFLLLDSGMILCSFERTIHAVEATFSVLETVIGFFVVKLMVQNQAVKFYTMTQGAIPEDLTDTPKEHCA